MATEIASKAIGSVKWVALSDVVARTVPSAVAIIVARWLSPTAYGLVGIAVIVTSFAQLFWDAGLSRMLVQKGKLDDDTVNTVFWINAIAGAVLCTIALTCAGYIAALLGAPEATNIVRAMCIGVLLAAVTSVHTTIFVRDLDFQKLFKINLATAIFPCAATLTLAIAGFGVWALVVGSLLGQGIQAGLTWWFSRWRPACPPSVQTCWQTLRCGGWYYYESLLGYLFVQGDSLVVSTVLNVNYLGLYRMGKNIVDFAYSLPLKPLQPIAYPAFSRLSHNRGELVAAFHKVNKLVFLIVWPMGVFLTAIGPQLVECVFGAKWQGLGNVVGLLGAITLIAWLVGLNSDVLRAIGRPDINSRVATITLPLYFVAWIVSAGHGLHAFLLTRLGCSLVGMTIHICVARKFIGVPFAYIWQQGRTIILSAVASAGVVVCATLSMRNRNMDSAPGVSVIILTITELSVYCGLLFLIDRPFIKHVNNLLRRAILG